MLTKRYGCEGVGVGVGVGVVVGWWGKLTEFILTPTQI